METCYLNLIWRKCLDVHKKVQLLFMDRNGQGGDSHTKRTRGVRDTLALRDYKNNFGTSYAVRPHQVHRSFYGTF